MLKQRFITAALLVPIVVGLLFYLAPAYFCILSALVYLMGAMEFMVLMGLKTIWARVFYLILIANAMFGLLFVPTSFTFIVGMIWWLIALVLVLIYPRATAFWSRNKIIMGLIGMLVLLPSWVAMNFLRNAPNGSLLLLYIFVLIWGADTTAYFAGRRWGAAKLAPNVSPGKTVAGAVAALVFALIFSTIAAAVSNPPAYVLLSVVGLAFVTVIFSIVGDLFESAVKREAGFKDSGNLLPGHGGMLDRIDSMTAALPVYAFVSILLSFVFMG